MDKKMQTENRLGKSQVLSINSSASLRDAVKMMREHHVGDVVVTNSDTEKKPIGIITDRDVALKFLNGAAAPSSLKVSDVISSDRLISCRVDDDIFDMIKVMKDNGVTRLPLVDQTGSLVRIVTARNLLQHLTKGLNDLIGISSRQRENEIKNH